MLGLHSKCFGGLSMLIRQVWDCGLSGVCWVSALE